MSESTTNSPEPTSEERTYSFFTWFGVAAHLGLSFAICIFLVFLWALTDQEAVFWPGYPLTVFGAFALMHVLGTCSIHGMKSVDPTGIRIRHVSQRRMGLELNAVILLSLDFMLWVLWAITEGGRDVSPPWPTWTTFGIFLVLGFHSMFVFLRSSNEAYTGRIAQLSATRTGVVEAQELELRRIERNLHDGAQARIVALNMQLGLAQQQLSKSPDAVAELLKEARTTTREVLRELRDLARGIYPPILSDRGLVPAIESLVASTPLAISVESSIDKRLPAAIEGALYFVVAEALANAVKHADCQRVVIAIRQGQFDVALTITDDGQGDVNAEGSGLIGMRQRVEALDGRLDITSPAGGPTTIRVELPCAL